MRRILEFGDFNRLYEAKHMSLDELMMKDLVKGFVVKRLVNTVSALPSFEGFYTKLLRDGEYGIFYRWKGEERDSGVVYKPNIEPIAKDNARNRFDFNKEMKSKFPNYQRWDVRTHFDGIMERMIAQGKEESGNFNPFDSDLDSLPVMRDLKDIGAQIVPTPLEKKNGTVAIQFPGYPIVYTLQKSGYIRRRGITGYLSTKPELIKPILSLDDLTPKLTYVYNIYLKDIAQSEGMSTKEINDIIRIFNDSLLKGLDNEEYRNKYQEVTQKYPSSSLFLPKPKDFDDGGLRQGASLLKSFGIF
jgi:hypothetical protein